MLKHIFIINPTAGKGSEAESILDKIRDGCEVSGVSYEIYKTSRKGDATIFVKRRIAEKKQDNEYRFYACGGDGTLSEVVNGAVDERFGSPIPGVHIGCVPIGTGNDFVRNFEHREFFLDVTKQILGDPITIDCFAVNERYGINMFNAGFDCDVVCKTFELKKKPFIPKSLIYIAGIVVTLKRNLGRKIKVTRPNGDEISREFQLCAVANGGFCGGGFNSAPYRGLDDGLLDISLINKVSRINFLSLVGPYKKGTHLKTHLGKKVVTYFQDKSITFSFINEASVCIDGEIETMREAVFRVIPKAVSFLLPVGVFYKAPLPIYT